MVMTETNNKPIMETTTRAAIRILTAAYQGFMEQGKEGFMKEGVDGRWAMTDHGQPCEYDDARACSFTLNGAIYWATDWNDLPHEGDAWKLALDCLAWQLEQTDAEQTDPGEWADLPATTYEDVLGLLRSTLATMKEMAGEEEQGQYMVYEDEETGKRWPVAVGSREGAEARNCRTVFGPATLKECKAFEG
jgi:hypothetical protein